MPHVPHVLFYECGSAPTTRSIRQLTALRRSGWDVTVVNLPAKRAEVEAMGFRSVSLPAPERNPYSSRLLADEKLLAGHLKVLKARPDATVQLSRRLAELDSTLAQLAPRQSHRDRLERLRARIDQVGGGRRTAKLFVLRAQRKVLNTRMRAIASKNALLLKAATAERTALVEKLRVIGVDSDAAAVEARLRAVQAARRTMTPLTEGGVFGDLSRMELWWQDAARALAAVEADVLWAADLDALPPVVWAAQAGPKPRPVIFDSHELFADLDYLPEGQRSAWQVVAERYIPKADFVFTVSPQFAEVLEREYGAKSPYVIPNLAMAGPSPDEGVRDVLQLDAETPLVVHIGTVSPGRHPTYVVNLLAGRSDLHVAFVGAAAPALVAEIKAKAEEFGASERLHFVEPVPLPNLVGFLRGTDLTVIIYDPGFSRNYELTMPNKLFDSLSAGIPVVTTMGTAIADFITRERVGGVFPIELPYRFDEVVSELLEDKEVRQRIADRAHEFLFTHVEEDLDKILRGLAESAG